ncbi:HAMP domain-containing protein [Tumebacillus sp. ITR2]|uniref:Heme sensor protein HssS n=1 Tax=Tumebacillus amylolyticus TaxID=2801339 RepID=A0ABS1J660_9BACL|nr:HAMP domain-containing sensor histidine kinase [Tumebacillus amylolyticus]MBL0385739.1 HAMP domain-containing protein [Tumebacillus amylolyticus]
MRTLYVRIVVLTILALLVSSVLSFLLANLYYQSFLKSYNEEKLMGVAESLVAEYEANPTLELDPYLQTAAHLNYQLFTIDEQGHRTSYGTEFKDDRLDDGVVQRVLGGEKYQGILENRHGLFVTGFFENTLQNSVGVPLHVGGKTYAVFLRPDIERMFGEVRVLLAFLLVGTLVLSLLFLVVFMRFVVKPINRLTAATQKIAEGEYDIRLESSRRDEIGELARQFSKMAGELKQVEAMRQEFVSNVSHEIQSPLTSIKGFSQALRTADMEADERDLYLGIIEAESERLSSLSKQLLTLASLERESAAPDKTPYRLDEQIREAVLVLEWQWQEKNLHMALDLPEVTVQGDRQLLHLVWINLLTNAIKFTPAEGSVEVELINEGSDLWITIRDTGIGIPASEVPRVFERFYKGDKSRNRTAAGSGLGLAIVSKIVALHRGHIHVESEWGVGTEVRVRLPRL